MLTFLIRRTIGAILVCIAVTFIVFLIFIVAPGGGARGTAERIAGKNATPQNVINIEHRWGFDKPFYVQYWRMLKRMFTNNLVSYTSQQPVLSQIVQGMPATFSLTIGAGSTQRFAVNASDPDGDILTYTWRVNGAVVGGNTNAFNFSGTPGGYVVNVTVSDGSLSASREWTVTVGTEVVGPSPLFSGIWPYAILLVIILVAILLIALARRRRKPEEPRPPQP